MGTLKAFAFYTFCFYTIGLLLITIFSTTPLGMQVGMDLIPDTPYELEDIARDLVKGNISIEDLPEGVWIDDNRSTQRIFCLTAWDGSWTRWSWSGGSMPIETGTGWRYALQVYGWYFGTPLLFAWVLLGVVSAVGLLRRR